MLDRSQSSKPKVLRLIFVHFRLSSVFDAFLFALSPSDF